MAAYPKPVKTKKEKKRGLKRSPIRKVSEKQEKELAKRRRLKAELISELSVDARDRKICPQKCKGCDRVNILWPGLELIHKKALSRGGKTERSNVELGCQQYHGEKYHGAHYR